MVAADVRSDQIRWDWYSGRPTGSGGNGRPGYLWAVSTWQVDTAEGSITNFYLQF